MWVIGEYNGRRAASVLDHAAAGIGYIVLEQGGSKINPFCIAAFRYYGELPLADHLTEVADPVKIRQYERMKGER